MSETEVIANARRVVEGWRDKIPHLVQPEAWASWMVSLLDAYDLATQRADAAEAERDRLADDRARFPDRPDDVGRMIEARRGSLEDGIKSANAYAREAINRAEKAEAERDALRTVDDAMVERFMFGYESVYRDGSTHSFSIRSGLDAALAVQP